MGKRVMLHCLTLLGTGTHAKQGDTGLFHNVPKCSENNDQPQSKGWGQTTAG